MGCPSGSGRRALADVLVVSGRLLRSPSLLCWSLPAAALTVARLHGYEPGLSAIAWPSPSPGPVVPNRDLPSRVGSIHDQEARA